MYFKAFLTSLLSIALLFLSIPLVFAVDYASFVQERSYEYASYIQYTIEGDSYFTARDRDGNYFIIYNFEEFWPYTHIQQSVVGINSNFVWFITQSKEVSKVFINGRESDEFKGISWLYLSPNEKHYVYIAYDGDNFVMIKDGEWLDKYPSISEFSFTNNKWDDFSFIGSNGEEATLYHNRDKVATLPVISWAKINANGDYAYIGKWEQKRKVFSSLWESREYENIGDLVMSPDGWWYAFKAQDGGKRMMVINGDEYQDFDMAYGFKYGEDASQFTYIAERGIDKILIKNRDEVGTFDDLSWWGYISGSSTLSYKGNRGTKIQTGEY